MEQQPSSQDNNNNANNNNANDNNFNLEARINELTEILLKSVMPSVLRTKTFTANIIRLSLLLLTHPSAINTLAVLHRDIETLQNAVLDEPTTQVEQSKCLESILSGLKASPPSYIFFTNCGRKYGLLSTLVLFVAFG